MKLRAETVLAYAAEKYKLDPSQYEITADNKIINLNNRQKSKKVIDFLVKEQNLTAREVIGEVGLDVYGFLRKEIHLTSREAIREANKVLDNQSIQLNIKLQDKGLELHLKLIEMVKSETYSNIDSKGNFNPYFIINLNKDITQKEAEATLRSKKIEGIVITGDKGVRVVISLNKPIDNSIKEDEYKELQSQVFNTLDFKGKAIFDSLTKQYKPYSLDVVPISVKGYKFDLSKQQIKAKAIISEKRAEAKVRADTVEELIRTKVTAKNELDIHSFTYIDKEAIMGIDIISLIKKCEKINDLELEERYIIENNFAYDLDSKKILNPYSYMMDNFQGNSEKVARELKNLLDEDFIKTNTVALEEVIFKVMKIAVTDTDISKEIAEHFEVEKCNLDMNKEQFTIEQRTVKFEEIGLTKEKLIESYEANRGADRITEEDLTKEIRDIHKEEKEDKKSSVTIKQGM